MYAWKNLRSQRRHLADNFEMTTYCGIRMYSPVGGVHRAPRWESLGSVEAQSLGSQKRISPDLCLKCAMLAQPFYFESETGQKFGKPISRTWVDTAV